jgi:hypothetical protein
MIPMLKTKSLKVGAADNKALFIPEKIAPMGAKASAVLFTKFRNEGLF